MAKITIFITLIFVLFISINLVSSAADCPSYSKVTSCSPKCYQDNECSSIGGKCCPNLCNAKSCVLPHQYGNAASDAGYKGQSSGAGTYCGNVKCSPYEKCEMDRTTKRMKCVRT